MVALYGRVETDKRKRGGLQLIQPQFEILSDPADSEGEDAAEIAAARSLEVGRIVPIYESAAQGKLTSRWFRRVIHGALVSLAPEIPDGIPRRCARAWSCSRGGRPSSRPTGLRPRQASRTCRRCALRRTAA